MNSEPLAAKWKAFGWNVMEIDGHDIEDILASIKTAADLRGKPTIILAKTVKGKGVSFMENQVGWHGNAPSPEQGEQALAELKGGVNND
jgi:transketolase